LVRLAPDVIFTPSGAAFYAAQQAEMSRWNFALLTATLIACRSWRLIWSAASLRQSSP
jgi:hypothetical protein